jgi:glycerol-3-phosphate acyltransferase PlsY
MLSILLLIIGYLFGSVNSAILVCKITGRKDPRGEGSCNPGASNVLRVAGKACAIATVIGDVLKGMIAIWIAMALGASDFILALVALTAVLGHMYPLFFKFQGGKGVATAIGCYFALSIPLGGIALVIWIVLAAVFRYASVASLVACVAAAVLSIYIQPADFIGLAIIALFVIWRHRGNIDRLRKGTESKLVANKPEGS